MLALWASSPVLLQTLAQLLNILLAQEEIDGGSALLRSSPL